MTGSAQVRQLCEAMGEELEVATYDRFTELAVEPSGLKGGYKSVQPGDCIVAFSRKTIYAIKQVPSAIDAMTPHPALGPGLRVLG
jgi:ATP-dependent RNA helicase SUPV3L1/SUV3